MSDLATITPNATLSHSIDEKQGSVASTSLAYDQMCEHWDLIHDLMGGTLAMRKAGRKWLPAYEKETDAFYETRLKSSFLYEALKDTVEKLTSKPFAKPVQVDGLPSDAEYMLDDIDREGTSIDAFARDLFSEALQHGLVHVLVDVPTVAQPEGRNITKDEEAKLGVRPCFVLVSAANLIAWKEDVDDQGHKVLSEARIFESGTRSVGEYSEEPVSRIRVFTTTAWELWEKGPKDKAFARTKSGVHGFGKVPLVTIYFKRTGFMTGEPPLEGLAWKNVEHWQSSSDQRNCLRVARFARFYVFGLSDDEQKRLTTVGPNVMISGENTECKTGFAEPTGAALGAGKDDIALIEDQMQVLGLEPLMEKTAPATATGRDLDAGKTHSTVQTWVRQTEDGLEGAFEMAGERINKPLSVEVSIFDDFGISLARSADIASLLAMRTAGEIDRKTFLDEIKRRGVLSDTVDVQKVIALVEAEGPALGMMNDAEGSQIGMGSGGPSQSGAGASADGGAAAAA